MKQDSDVNDVCELLNAQQHKNRGIYGAGILRGSPRVNAQGDWRVRLQYIHKFEPPILGSRLLKHRFLKKLRILRPPFQGTNFRATKEQWEVLGLGDSEVEPEEIQNPLQFPEGTTRKVSVNVYERNPEARQVCLDHYGYHCLVCGFDFEKFYGPRGRKFIHVHHLRQLSQIKKEYIVDPILDLRPVCPNCHAMIHKGSKMLTMNNLKRLIQGQR